MRHRTYREQTLKVDSASSFRGMYACLLIVGAGYLFFACVVGDRPLYWFYDLAVAPLLYAVLLLAAVAYLRRRLTITIMPEGVRTFDVWGRYFTAPWESISSARRWSFFGMPSARLKTTVSRTPLWLPLNLEKREVFEQLLVAYTEPAHPLRRATRTAGRTADE